MLDWLYTLSMQIHAAERQTGVRYAEYAYSTHGMGSAQMWWGGG